MILNSIKMIMTDLYCGLSFFSRLPLYRFCPDHLPLSFARAVWTWPIISTLLGGLEALFLCLLTLTQLNSWIIALMTLGFHLLLTGGLHEDGLADCADGFGGGTTTPQKLTIMKDSRLGTYGVLTLFIILAIQTSAITSLINSHKPLVSLLIITAVLSRTAMLGPLIFLKPARPHGIANTLNTIPLRSYSLHLGIAGGLSFMCLPLRLATMFVTISCLISITATLFINHQIKGYNGDSLGAVQVIAATIILTVSTLYIN